MIARALPAMLAGPLSGVLLDRFDRRRIMIASDLFRFAVALGFILILTHQQRWLLYVLSGLLMFASPFFSSGRSAILPSIATPEQLHTANALTQTTSWVTLTIGTFLGGAATMQFGYEWAFVVNAASFLVSAGAVALLRQPGGFRANRSDIGGAQSGHTARAFVGDFRESVAYMRATPLILAVGLAYVGWASGGGAAQVLFTLFGEIVFRRGPAGIGIIWGAAGLGLVIGGILAHRFGARLRFAQYKKAISIGYLIHGAAYILYALMPTITLASLFIGVSRIAMGSNSVLNRTVLLTHVPDRLRGRIFSLTEMMLNGTMMISVALASAATDYISIRMVGVIAGVLSASTSLFWWWADTRGKLVEPRLELEPESTEYETTITPG